MISTLHRYLSCALWLGTLWCAFVAEAGAASAVAAELPGEALASFERSAEALSGVTVKWRMDRASDRPLSDLLATIGYPQHAHYFLKPIDGTITLEGPRFYAHFLYSTVSLTRDRRLRAVVEQEQETSFDGEFLYFGGPRGNRGKGVLIIDTPERLAAEGPGALLLHSNYFHQAGFKIVEFAEQAGAPPRSLVLDLIHDQDAKVVRADQEDLDGVPCTAIHLETRDGRWVFHLDPSLGHAVRRREERAPSGELRCRATMGEFVEPAGTGGVWLPKRCEVAHYQWFGKPSPPEQKPLCRETYTVLRLSHDEVPDDRFVMMYTKPGATISDGSLPEASKSPTGRIEYIVPADPADLDKTIQHAVDGTPFVPSDVPRRPWRLLVLSAVNVAIFVAMATLFWVYRRKARLRRQQRG